MSIYDSIVGRLEKTLLAVAIGLLVFLVEWRLKRALKNEEAKLKKAGPPA